MFLIPLTKDLALAWAACFILDRLNCVCVLTFMEVGETGKGIWVPFDKTCTEKEDNEFLIRTA